jgi:MFS family permease
MQLERTNMSNQSKKRSQLFFWFSRSDFYVTGLDFVFSRIALISQSTALPYFLEEVCNIKDDPMGGKNVQLALAPAASFIGSFIFSIFIQDKFQRYHLHDKYNLFLYSILYFLISLLLMIFIKPNTEAMSWLLYGGLFLQGFGMANMMNSSVSLVSEMIGQDDEASAIVFACFNIVESFSVGGVAFIIMASGMT